MFNFNSHPMSWRFFVKKENFPPKSILPFSSSFADGIGPFVNISRTSGAGSVVDPGAVGGDGKLNRLRKGDPLHLFKSNLL